MFKEIDLLRNYPKAKRDLKKRSESKSEEDREIARKFGKDFFDGDRKHGYGGFKYMEKFWKPVIPDFTNYWKLTATSSILDVGCAKGFMMHDFKEHIPGITIKGVDISNYAIENCIDTMKNDVLVADAKQMPFEDNSFDIVISINTIHNLVKDECAKALQEIERIKKIDSFVTVDAYRNDEEKERMYAWNLTAKTIMSVDEWKNFFREVGYTGDYYWFIP
tara:strand:+ start:1652 stop:2311 length:660 start_codon:yes stop_codon:yes gene_type:complete